MNTLKKIYCRTFQAGFRTAFPFLPYTEPKILTSVSQAAEVVKKLGVSRVMLVTDKNLRECGITKPLEDILQNNGIKCAVYDKTLPNPTVKNVEEARELYIKENCRLIIAFGGGSPIDCAKAAGARIAYPEKSLEEMKGTLRIMRQIPTLIAIPTTAGSGSEVTLTAVITNHEDSHKYTINAFPLIPSYAVLDADVTLSLPPKLTAATGMDALTHAVEAYIGQSTTEYTRKNAIQAVKLIISNIEQAYNQPHNRTARCNMLRASYLAGIAFSRSYVGYVHAVAHTLGGQYNIPHGLANAVLLPIVLEDYGDVVHIKLKELATASGIAQSSDTPAQASEKFISHIRSLNAKMDIPKKLPGIKKEDIPLMAHYADKESNPLYPVPVLMGAKELEKFYYKVMEK